MFTGSGISSVTHSDNCAVDALNLNLMSLNDTDSISLIADADSTVQGYSFSNDNGNTWVNTTNNNIFTFNALTSNKIYIK